MIHKRIFVGGINSSGKTDFANEISSVNKDLRVIHGSSEFMRWLGIEKNDYKSLESLSDGFKDNELSKMIYHLFRPKDCDLSTPSVFVGHFGLIKNNTVLPSVGDWIKIFDLMILLTANPSIILSRIIDDCDSGKRYRGSLIKFLSSCRNPEIEIGLLMKKTELIADGLSSRYSVPIIKLDSTNHSAHELAQITNRIINRA